MNRYFDNLVLKNPVFYFVYLLIGINLAMMALYFSGSEFLQSLIVPLMVGLEDNSWREFGLLEMLQNLLLLGVIVILIYGLVRQTALIDKGMYFLAVLVFLFLFLEEIDYGLHYYEFITGNFLGEDQLRNWHNQTGADGHQHTRKIKKIADIAMILIFILLPLVCALTSLKKNIGKLNFIPVMHFSVAVVVAVVLSKLAHFLNDSGFGVINGVEGKLDNNISEFRETSMYYIYVLYALQLVRHRSLFSATKTEIKP